ncbi:MAG: prepilin-type N-terminal cleavage/methylation domain-containing protein [Armatimonadetes bacterium]|nr:prepilin-type N-terminal cleavage/methylation domain-containing protein [Armatimonadota bacterium]
MSKGFTLLELMVAVALMLLIGALGILTTYRTTSAAESRGLAQEIAEELRAARQRAISTRTPVAVVFPSGGVSGHGQGLYILEGHTQPRITRQVLYSSHYPRACWFVGLWPLAASGKPTRDAPPNATQNSRLDPTTWGAPVEDDFIIMFTPSGTVRTNGLALFDGEYHVLSSLGIEYGGGEEPPGSSPTTIPYFTASAAAQPYTIHIAPTGAIRVEPGASSSAGLTIGDGALGMNPPAALPPVSSAANQDPVLVSSTAEPEAPSLPSGVSAVVSPGGYLTLRLSADDPDGDPLYASWTAEGPNGGGAFSSASETQMEWDLETGNWLSVWTWTPPAQAVLGEKFTLSFRVEDKRGGVLTGELGSSGVVSMGTGGLIAYTSDFDSEEEVGYFNDNGTGAQFASGLRDEIDHFNVSWSPDGTKLASFGWDFNGAAWESVFVMNRDGSGFQELYGSQEGFYYSTDGPRWSADGTYMIYSELDSDWWGEIWKIRLSDGTRTRLVANGSSDVDYFQARCSPNKTSPRIVYVRDSFEWSDGTTTIWTCRPDGSDKKRIAAKVEGQYDYDPNFSPDGSAVTFVRWGASAGASGLFTVPSDGSAPEVQVLTADKYDPGYPACGPDGTLIAFHDLSTDDLYVITVSGTHPDTGIPNEPKRLTTSGDVEGYSWNPNGGQLVYSTYGGELKIVNVAGATVTTVSSADEPKFLPCWWVPAP